MGVLLIIATITTVVTAVIIKLSAIEPRTVGWAVKELPTIIITALVNSNHFIRLERTYLWLVPLV